VKPRITETTALGAAYLAGLAVDFWNDLDEISQKWQAEKTFKPAMDEKVRTDSITGWKNSVSKVLSDN
jgi:glycerol kinase